MDEYYFPGLTQHASGITMLASAVIISNPTLVPTLDPQSTYRGSGRLSGEFPSALTTVEGVPVSAQVLVRYRAAVPGGRGDGLLVASTTSSPTGEWSVQNLNSSLRFDVSARYPGENDALQANVRPFDDPRFSPMQIPVGVPVDEPLPIIGGTGSVSATYVSGSFPSGVSLVGNRLQGAWPTGATGSYPVTFDLTDDEGTFTHILNIELYLLPMELAGGVPTTLIVGDPVSSMFTASGGEGPYSYAVTAGSLPAGLSLNGSTGELSGTPTTLGAYSFDITATDVRSAPASRAYSGIVIGDYEQTALYSSATALWLLDELSGTTASDATGNGHTGTWNGSPSLGGTSIVRGAAASAGFGPNGWVAANSIPAELAGTPFSICVWAKAPGSGSSALWAINTSSGGDRLLFFADAGTKLRIFGSSNSVFDQSYSWGSGARFIVYTYNAGTHKVYADGALVGTASSTVSVSSSDKFSIGQEFDDATPGDFWQGQQGGVAVFTRELTAQEIALLFVAGAP